MKKLTGFLALLVLVTLFACDSGTTTTNTQSNKSTHSDMHDEGMHSDNHDESMHSSNSQIQVAVVKEVLQTTSYTYLKFANGDQTYWGAIPRRDDIVVGKTYYFDSAMEMENFPSKELDRTFDRIYFIESISDQAIPKTATITPDQKGSSKVGNMKVENIGKVAGGITIGELYGNKSDYAGKKVKIKGKVVKFTPGVMGKNWVHIQDGTQNGNNLDVTITTADVVEIDDIAAFEGTVALDKDFGYGYAYDLIIEDARLLQEK